jgi:hypothetical protein
MAEQEAHSRNARTRETARSQQGTWPEAREGTRPVTGRSMAGLVQSGYAGGASFDVRIGTRGRGQGAIIFRRCGPFSSESSHEARWQDPTGMQQQELSGARRQ